MESMLNLQTEEPVKKSTLKKYKIICAVLAVLLVVVSLGLGLGLGLRRQEQPGSSTEGSCRNKCQEKLYRGLEGCQCDTGCKQRQNCCWDFEEVCVKPTQIWTCNPFRCGETRIANSHCSCSEDCMEKKDCCPDYRSVCKGETPWVKEECGSNEAHQCPQGFDLPPVILLSLDGFRAEYLQTWGTLMPNINKLKTCGIHSQYMRAVYPTKTFPNHYTIVTGLYPESHGIIDNSMYDVTINKNFSLSSNEKFNSVWWAGQPIWLTAMYQGLKAGTYFWPGSDVNISGTYPSLYKMYNKSSPFGERVFSILQWLDLPKSERPDFYTLYVEEPDTAGHSSGPVSGDVIKSLEVVDQTLGMLMDGLKQRNLHNCVNIIILADHGMDKTDCKKLEYMTDYFPKVDFFMYEGPAARIRAKNIPTDFFSFDSEGIVKNLSCRKEKQHFKPFLTPDLPKRFHYANNIRIDKVHLYVDRQWQAVRSKAYTFCKGGNHGYDNEFKSMEAIFLAHGPDFKDKTEVEPFENIEIYNLLCDLLHIKPAPNNGTHGSLNHLLKAPFYTPSFPKEVSSPIECPFGPTESNISGCRCPLQNIDVLNQRLNLSSSKVNETVNKHLPYGRPRVLQSKSYCQLFQEEYVSGFDHDIQMPLWSAYTILKPGDTSPLPPTMTDCLRADVRIPAAQSQNCSFYEMAQNITHDFLFPPTLNETAESQYDALITSNFIPMHEQFRKIWNYFHQTLLIKYASERNGVNVISGPIFDYNYDGHFDTLDEIMKHAATTIIPIPTHYFVLLTSCKNRANTPLNCSDSLDTLPFILPHRPDNVESCAGIKSESEWVEERVEAHTARVRDVELLTGLDFYQESKWPVSEVLKLKTFLPTFETII
ncbi:ectonucleotide pyrophosphatase/phosphodiesterase family member 3 [Ornithorhynchus anatinus]|uniref:Ectonucleotide pyrophosphatase/phosphodiesterase family member 3 n=1 Tax=Ornithorhynchus anatinus TaxID=9258 RepID=A0A6I8NWS7_ORNAN|nr:ectonucleotide pyrophosphatase/phosphodiesterase family member 3 [Ornithorhynchus anatinus]XP_007669808.2 ectonucleotide pyrophosphatase/phosphodiesterase family member 3 [Ornithorhynchus anatinus]XP_028914195.1 ectonucleotide pyrophosphatase/phosphodiesterase family member 3 [Ornithorhynchus anatinus]